MSLFFLAHLKFCGSIIPEGSWTGRILSLVGMPESLSTSARCSPSIRQPQVKSFFFFSNDWQPSSWLREGALCLPSPLSGPSGQSTPPSTGQEPYAAWDEPLLCVTWADPNQHHHTHPSVLYFDLFLSSQLKFCLGSTFQFAKCPGKQIFAWDCDPAGCHHDGA